MTTIGEVLFALHAWAGSPPAMKGMLRSRFGDLQSRYRFQAKLPERCAVCEVEGRNAGWVDIRVGSEMWSLRPGGTARRSRSGYHLTVLDNHFSAVGALVAADPPALTGKVVVLGREASLLRIAEGRPWADEVEFAVDTDTGLVLRRVAWRGGQELATELEELELDIELPEELVRDPAESGIGVREPAYREIRSPLVEELPARLSFPVWGPARARDLFVRSIEDDGSAVILVWLEEDDDGAVVVEARQGPRPSNEELSASEQVETGGGTLFAGARLGSDDGQVVHFQRGPTWIEVRRRGTRERAVASALSLVLMSDAPPSLVHR